ncbi:VanZ family protein [Streptomyces sp. NPDC098781]|uniref:VanZ family protein n=1 Tax=Streptomyces sp. NPDC098781 TaxID=3366097 RepID=UPI00382CE833
MLGHLAALAQSHTTLEESNMGDVNLRFEAIPVFAPLIALFLAFLALRAARGKAGPRWDWKYVPVRMLTAIYIAGVLGFTFFPFQIMYGKYADHMVWYNQVNWLPLVTLDSSAIPNVILTVPLGMALPILSGKVTSARRALALGAAFSLAIEVAQVLGCVLFNNYRGADVNDVIVNALGCMLGYWIVRQASKVSFLKDLLQRLALPGSVLATGVQSLGAVTHSQVQPR